LRSFSLDRRFVGPFFAANELF